MRQTLLAATLLAPLTAQAAAPFTVRDLLQITRFSSPTIAPDGKTIAVLETHPDLEHDSYYSELILVDAKTGAKRPLTRDRHHVGQPHFAPDGSALAFLAADGDKKPQVFILPLNGGDANQVTHAKDGVDQYAWSPDSKVIAFAATDPAPERKGEAKYATGFEVHNDDFTLREAPRPAHIWTVPAAGGDAKRLTSGMWSLPTSLPPGPPSSPLQFTPDGKSLIFVRQATPSTGDQLQTQLEILDIASGKYHPLNDHTTLDGYPVISPDGSKIAYWRPRDGKPYQFQDAWVQNLSGGPARDVTEKLDKNLYLTTWLPDGKTLLVGANDATSVGLWLQPLDGPATRLITGDIVPVNSYWVDAELGRQGQIVFTGQTVNDPDELYIKDSATASPRALTDANAPMTKRPQAKAEAISWQGPQGKTLDGILTYPTDFAPGKKYPLVLVIHGGPNSASKLRFSLLNQVLATKGFLVFEPNYRGSDNQDNAFFASIYGDAGAGPGADVISGVTYLQGRGFVDPDRMAVTGWSYGGFMTTWMAGHYTVWKAAVAGAAVTDWVEMYDLGDGNITIAPQQTGASPYLGDGLAINRRQSPDNSVTHIKAPTLILSDTGDFRVPITQSFGLYRALHDNGVETQFIAYPIGGHFPSDPVRQMDVYQRWTDWVVGHLK
jgi:dipeptidyl aminopeptidase/acylaminoacyl peptidase